jgi:hypothetical protein
MLLVVVRLLAFQERHMKIFEVVRTNPSDAGLHAQFDQAAHEVVVVAAELRGLEARWGFRAWSPPAAPYSASRFLGFEVRKKVVCFGCEIGCNGTKFSIALHVFGYIANIICIHDQIHHALELKEKVARGYSSSLQEEETAALSRAGAT